MPVTWLLGSLLYALFTKNTFRKKVALRISVVLAIIFTNPMLVNEGLLAWEEPPVPLSDLKNYDVGIVLTGIANNVKKPYDRLYFNKGADRITLALTLYKAKKIKKILISGGEFFENRSSEGQNLKEFLLITQVPEQDIIVEDSSLNTKENAVNSARILSKYFPEKKYLLITSAFHMKRAKGCFSKAGVNLDTFSVDFYSQQRTWSPAYWLVPSEKSFYYWYVLIHEVVGYIVYKALGYA